MKSHAVWAKNGKRQRGIATQSLEQHRNNLGLVWTGSNWFCKILSSSELQTGPSVQFGHWPELSNWTWVWFCQYDGIYRQKFEVFVPKSQLVGFDHVTAYYSHQWLS